MCGERVGGARAETRVFREPKVKTQDSEANENSNDATILRAGMVGEVENNARQHKEDQLALQARLYNTRVLLSLHCCKQKAMEGTRATGLKKKQATCKL